MTKIYTDKLYRGGYRLSSDPHSPWRGVAYSDVPGRWPGMEDLPGDTPWDRGHRAGVVALWVGVALVPA